MSHDDDNDDEGPSPTDAITRDVRARRAFSLAGALAGQDGGGHLAGASPVAAQQQFAYALAQWLAASLPDAEGSLRRVLAREIAGRADLIGDDPSRPQRAVAAWLREVLPRPAWVQDLVRETDAEWGRRQNEKPRFEQPGQAPSRDDPYTVADVAARLAALLARAEHGGQS